jgi:hypothetical protein
MRLLSILYLFGACLATGCHKPNEAQPQGAKFGKPSRVTINGYTGNSMEPFLSRDGSVLFFNNLNSAPENTDLHWSTKINDTTFQYQGELSGINTPALEAVATMDSNGVFYFVSDRNYATTFCSIYKSTYLSGTISNIAQVDSISKYEAGWVNFDVEVNASGEYLYFVDGRFDQNGGPYEADIILAGKKGANFQREANSAIILKNINTSDLEYAACISADDLQLYFTRTSTSVSNPVPVIYQSSRNTPQDIFGVPSPIQSIIGFVEAPTISPDGKTIYYHKNEGGKFVIYCVKKE